MRIVHVTDTFLPRLGGIELHVADLAAHQRAAGHEPVIVTAERKPDPDGASVTAAGVPVLRGQRGSRLIADLQPDLVHAHLSVASPFAWKQLRRNTAPAVATMHSLLPARPGLVRAGLKVTGLPTDRISFTAVSHVAADRLRAALPPGQPVSVLHNGIDPEGWRVPHTPSPHFEILVVGRLAARKRPLLMAETLGRLAALLPDLDWRATFVGDGGKADALADAVRRLGLADRVRLAGRLDRAEIRTLLGSADVLVAPATLESFGIAALEARCAGVPIVGMASSGVAEFVRDGVDGLLARDDADLADCLRRLAVDRALHEQIRLHNQTVSVPTAWPVVLDRHDAIYARAIATSGVRVPTRARLVEVAR